VCDEFWLVADGGVRPFDGDLDDYQKYLLDTARAQAKALRDANSAGKKATAAPAPAAKPVAATAPPAPASRDDRKADAQARQGRSDELKPLRKELNRVDNRLGVLFADRTAIEASLATGGLTPAQLADNGKKLKSLVEEISLLEGQWLELSTQVDELSAKALN
jgi:ATP-binding cassette subfamily F protein 3